MSETLRKFLPPNDEAILIPPDQYKFTADFIIYDNTIGYISREKEFAIMIDSKEIAEAMKSAFDLAFQGASTLKKKLNYR